MARMTWQSKTTLKAVSSVKSVSNYSASLRVIDALVNAHAGLGAGIGREQEDLVAA